MTKAIEAALFLHLLGVAVWIGGMVFAHFCLRPALGDLAPQLRLPLWEAVFARFFNWVAGAVLVILLTGGFLLTQYGGAHAAWPLHAMAGLGIVMMLIFGHIRFAVFPRIRRAVQAQNWPDGARAVGTVRRLVVVNLVLGIVTIGTAVLSRGI
ncbi:CopD family protein [Caballeronia sp. LZ062]|uniref:CopD family protein n=1 Tax=unclassified Caballeronia TaxID=2646786 RepID=UPI00285C75A0|nr:MULTISPECIES: CopD family protein [unclassified Caballeronia]MDR5854042.1 CopD family protein [Caballeronia sp. LZ050]MDR5871427.1 CopD family protein [Caballeronia sp. LZ062]